jgi:hypothetical protein
VVLGGAYLDGPVAAYVSGDGVQAMVLREDRQVSPQEQKALTERLFAIRQKRQSGQPLTPAEAAEAQSIRTTLDHYGRRLTNPSLGEFVTLRLTIAPDAPTGRRELRLLSRTGLSNPRPFIVGELPEYRRDDWRNVPASHDVMDAAIDPRPPVQDVTLPATLNGQIPPGGVCRYRWHARAGQRLLVTVGSRDLIPFVADAVPGWFEALACLYDDADREVARSTGFWSDFDPVLRYEVPRDEDLTLSIGDILFRGREDFVYRVTLGELPYVVSAFPAGGQVGTRAPVTLSGWNLPLTQVSLGLTDRPAGVFDFLACPGANPVPLQLDTLPECQAAADNGTPVAAQAVSLPVIVNGRINQPGDQAWYGFAGRAGDRLVAEVHARRLGSPMDSVLYLMDAANDIIAFNDDQPDLASALNTHHADSYLAVTLPASGEYRIGLGDVQHSGGPDYVYRLRLSAPRPDFALRVTPASLSIHGGASAPLTAYAVRQDGFGGPIELRLRQPLPGWSLTGATIPAGQDKVRFTLFAPAQAVPQPLALAFEGRAVVEGHDVLHAAVPAEDMTQAFSYHHLVPAQALCAVVDGRARPGAQVRWLTSPPFRLAPGGSLRLRVSVPVGPAIERLEFELVDAPAGLTVSSDAAGELTLHADAAAARAGDRGNLIVAVAGVLRQTPGGEPLPADRQRVPLGALPAAEYGIE